MDSVESAARELHHWFADVLDATDKSVFGIAPEGPHRGAVVLDVLSRNGRLLAGAEPDHEGRLYTPLCLFLAAACRKLNVSLGAGHWRAAIGNMLQLRRQLTADTKSTSLGLELGGPVHLFYNELKQSITKAGLAGVPTLLNPENKEIALGLAINWALRFLLAYAMECPALGPPSEGRKDLAWIASLLADLREGSPAAAPAT